MRIYWARGCPAFQLGPSRSCTRGGPARESVLRVPTTAPPAFLRMSAALQSSHIAEPPGLLGPQLAKRSWLSIFLAMSGLLSAYPPWEVTFLSKDRSARRQYHRFHGSRWGSGLPFCESPQLLLLEVFISQSPSGSNMPRCQGLRPQGARHPYPLAGGRSWTRAGSGPTHRPGTQVGSGGAGLLH